MQNLITKTIRRSSLSSFVTLDSEFKTFYNN